MHLPVAIREKTEEMALRVPRAVLMRAAERLSAQYRERQSTRQVDLGAEELVAAYLVTRFPATYAAAFAVFEECRARLAGEVASVVDLGAGCGAAAMAARAVFGAAAVELIESNVAMMAAGRELLPEGVWRRGSLGESAIPAADLVIANYALGELREGDRERVVERAWKAARVLVVVEAGSSAGFAVVRGIRDRLLGEGARMIAPCPGEASCPVAEGDWCHFGARLERSALHRQAKQGTLSYEDEKYSYVVLAKGEGARAAGRVIRRPVHQPGLVELMVCDGAKVVREQVRKKDKEKFRAARHAAWGGEWPAGERG